MRSSALLLALALAAPAALAQDVPPHPREIKYGELVYEPPKRADHRVVLGNGLRVYLVPDKSVPTVRVEAWIDAGESLLARGRRGAAKLCGELMRSGGIEGMGARTLDARLDAIAAEIEVGFGLEQGHASLWTLSKYADEAFGLFAKVLTKPVFEEDRIRRAKDQLKTEIAHRDDEPEKQLDHEVFEVLFGKDHPLAARETEETVDAVTREMLRRFHAEYVRPARTILAVSGDFDRAEMEKKLQRLFGEWPIGLISPSERADLASPAGPGVFILDRPTNQGFVEIVQTGLRLGDPDEIPLAILNYILGGGSFTSRITARVRNDEGLAYSAGSYVHPGRNFPGVLGLYFQSKAESTAFAAKICMEELEKIRTKPVGEEELGRARSSLVDRFPERFSTAQSAVAALAQAEVDRRPEDWFATYRGRVAAVTAEDVMRVAQKHLDPKRMSVVIVGPAETVGKEDEAHDAAIAKLGKVEALKED